MKTILITGASRGIGNYLAINLQNAGYHVVGIARSFPIKPEFENITCDVSDGDNVQSVFSSFKKNKTIFGLINCAGILHTKAVASITNNEISEIIDTNIKGTIFCCKNVIRPFLAHGSGRVINFSSIAAVSALRGDSVYSASKSAIETFTKAFAKEMSHRSVTVNCISPGVIKTDMTANLTDEQILNLVSLQIIQKQATLDDIFHSVNFLLSEESSMITGQSFNIGGV
jgi:3-oxoacyl-[acyl-carrier protein] reductase